MRNGALRDVARLPETEVSIAVKAPDVPQDQLFAADGHWSFGVHVDGSSDVLAGECDSPEELVARSANGPRSPTTPSR